MHKDDVRRALRADKGLWLALWALNCGKTVEAQHAMRWILDFARSD